MSLLISLSTGPDCIKSKSFNDNFDKGNGNMSDRVGDKELLIKKELVIEKKLEIEKEIEMEDLEDPELLISA